MLISSDRPRRPVITTTPEYRKKIFTDSGINGTLFLTVDVLAPQASR